MIYYNNQLMPDDLSARLFMVSNTDDFEKFEDHEAALHFYIQTLTEQSLNEGENPKALIEDYLGITYTEGNSIEEMSNFVIHTDVMQSAFARLKENWYLKEDNLGKDTLFFGSGMSQEEILTTYSTTTLRNYLETLSSFNNE